MSFQLNPQADTNGTYLQGYIKASYPELKRLFGDPLKSDDYKISGEWVFYDDVDGLVFTIYDWKSTSLYDPELPTVEQFRNNPNMEVFNVGGHYSAKGFIWWLEGELSKIRRESV